MAILHIIDNGKKYKLDDEMLDYFSTIYADCELNPNNDETYWKTHIINLIDAAKLCNHTIDEEIAEEILENYKDYSDDLKHYQTIDYIKMLSFLLRNCLM